MAGDWIKMRGNLWDDPRVSALVDATDTSEAMVIGGLYWLWATADQHTEDGIMPGLSLRQIDRKTGIKGFGEALVAIGWVAEHAEGVRIVNFEDHNGASAKKRAVTAKRVAGHRTSGNADSSPSSHPANADVTLPALQPAHAGVTGALAREREEIEEEKRNTEIPSDAYASGAEAPAVQTRPAVTVRDQVFAVGIALLTAAGITDKNARSFLAAQCKAHQDEGRVLAALQECARDGPIQPIPWLVAKLGAGKARAVSKHSGFAEKDYREGIEEDGTFS